MARVQCAPTAEDDIGGEQPWRGPIPHTLAQVAENRFLTPWHTWGFEGISAGGGAWAQLWKLHFGGAFFVPSRAVAGSAASKPCSVESRSGLTRLYCPLAVPALKRGYAAVPALAVPCLASGFELPSCVPRQAAGRRPCVEPLARDPMGRDPMGRYHMG